MKLYYVKVSAKDMEGKPVESMMAFNRMSDAEWNFDLVKKGKGIEMVELGTLVEDKVIRRTR